MLAGLTANAANHQQTRSQPFATLGCSEFVQKLNFFVRCSEEEGKARRERRTISGFILHSVLHRIANQKKLEDAWRKQGGGKQARALGESLD